jgi:hypothetical protein
MQSFSTDFPINPAHDSAEFLRAICEWLLGSPHTRLVRNDLKGLRAGDAWSMQKGNEAVEALRIALAAEESAAVRYTKREAGLEWLTTIVFCRQQATSWISISVSCESQHAAAWIPTAKKPVVVRTLLNRLGGGRDGEFFIKTTPVRLENVDIDVAARCISGQAGCRLPIVYVSALFQGGYIVNVDSLSESLAGMAHVVVEPNRAFSVRLQLDVNSKNVYGGTVGVYWPDGGGRRSFFLGPEADSASDVERAVFDEVRTALANRRPLARCTWAAVQEAVSRHAFKLLKEQGSTDIDKYMSEFDKELRAKEQGLSDAEREIARLQAEVRKLEARNPMGTGLMLATGKEQDFYNAELAEIVRDALTDAARHVPMDSRRQHVLN